ncbi:MAG: TRAP transporter small permease [Candidatus Stahlbacteria bacterium]|nr:MAG: TRAP transporter small permease [Candidatus Stahlbacteria bacterium]
MNKIEEKIRKSILYIEWTLASAFLSIMMLSVFLQVLARYVFHWSLPWPEELARYCFIWGSLLGAGIALERRKLHDIDIVVNQLPKIVQPFISFIVNLLALGFLVILVRYGIEILSVTHRQMSSALIIRMSYVYGAVPFAGSLMLISQFFNTIEKFFQLPIFTKKEKKI